MPRGTNDRAARTVVHAAGPTCNSSRAFGRKQQTVGALRSRCEQKIDTPQPYRVLHVSYFGSLQDQHVFPSFSTSPFTATRNPCGDDKAALIGPSPTSATFHSGDKGPFGQQPQEQSVRENVDRHFTKPNLARVSALRGDRRG